MSDGRQLLASLLSNGGVSAFRSIQRDWFLDDETPLYDFVANHFRRHGVLPSAATFEEDTGTPLPVIDEMFSYYLKRVTDRYVYGLVRPQFQELQAALRSFDIDRARDVIAAMQSAVRVSGTDADVRTLAEAGQMVLDAYDDAHSRPGMPGIPSGWTRFDDMTGGYQDGDLISFVARPELGKTYLMLYQADYAWVAGHSVLIISMEMTITQITRRALGIQSGINPDYIRKGRLSSSARAALGRHVNALQGAERYVVFAGNFNKNVSVIDALANEYEPDAIYIDGAYLLKPDTGKRSLSRLERVPEVFDALGELKVRLGRPIVLTTQFGRGAGKKGKDGSMENIAFSDAIGQHSSIVAAVKEGQPPYQESRRVIDLMKGREGERGSYQTHFSFSPMDFSEVPEDVVASESADLDWMA